MTGDADALASILLEAKRTASPVDGMVAPWIDLTPTMLRHVGWSIAVQSGASTSPYWKLGAIDAHTQERLGVDGPICAPLDPDCVSAGVSSSIVHLSSLIHPKFEPEIGVCVRDGRLLAMPCVEIADSRFSRWNMPPGGVLADGALQGRMIFGIPLEPFETINVTVRLDDVDIAHGSGTWTEASSRLMMIPEGSAVEMVATGALTALFNCKPGSWSFDFGRLGSIAVQVV